METATENVSVLATVLCVIAGFFAGWHLAYTSLSGVMFLIIADREEPSEIFARVDWSILVFFLLPVHCAGA
ncbi:MAG: hypothetical protein R2941_14620 [Desulfobacterales bacterium]